MSRVSLLSEICHASVRSCSPVPQHGRFRPSLLDARPARQRRCGPELPALQHRAHRRECLPHFDRGRRFHRSRPDHRGQGKHLSVRGERKPSPTSAKSTFCIRASPPAASTGASSSPTACRWWARPSRTACSISTSCGRSPRLASRSSSRFPRAALRPSKPSRLRNGLSKTDPQRRAPRSCAGALFDSGSWSLKPLGLEGPRWLGQGSLGMINRG